MVIRLAMDCDELKRTGRHFQTLDSLGNVFDQRRQSDLRVFTCMKSTVYNLQHRSLLCEAGEFSFILLLGNE